MNSNSIILDILSKGLVSHLDMFNMMEKDEVLIESVLKAALLAEKSVVQDGALYFCGNGGSAADSQHIATEFVSRFYRERNAINAEALTVNTSSITAIGNDYCFERVFVRQVEAKAHKGDTLFGISTSGTSKNILCALDYAASRSINTILLTGKSAPDDCEERYDCVIRVPSFDTPRIQEAHIFIGHILAEYIEQRIID